jgi:nitrile hydratase
MQEGVFPLADDCARGIEPAAAEMVYTVRFPAAALWGTGTHTVLLNLWESYLEEAG